VVIKQIPDWIVKESYTYPSRL